jgi:Fe-S-cluster containining protein
MSTSTATARIKLSCDEWELQTSVTVPAGPVRSRDLLPLFQSISDAVVDAAARMAEEHGSHISCKKGCGACCRMLVPISQMEARHIRDEVEALPEPRRTEIRERFATARRRLQEAGLLDELQRTEQWTESDYTTRAAAYFRLGIPCPFLEEESCSIHLQRPVTCREHLVTTPPELCARVEPPQEVRRVRIPLRVFNAVARMETPGSVHHRESWVPLVLAPEWADAHPDGPPRPGPEVLREFLDHLSKKDEP